MSEFSEKERELIVSKLMSLGLTKAADDFKKNGICRAFNSSTGKIYSLNRWDKRRTGHVKELFDSRTYLIIRTYDSRDNIGQVDFFLGLDDEDFTEFISAKPESGAISAPAFYSNYIYGVESFFYTRVLESTVPESTAWETITSIQLDNYDPDIDDDD